MLSLNVELSPVAQSDERRVFARLCYFAMTVYKSEGELLLTIRLDFELVCNISVKLVKSFK